MNGIYFVKFISVIFPTIFFIGGIFLIVKNWSNLISRIISSIIIILSVYSLSKEFLIKPNFIEIRNENERFELLESNNVELIIIEFEYIKREFVKKTIEISNRKRIKQIVDNLQINEISCWESDDYTPYNCYKLELKLINGKNMNFDICESEDNRTFINLMYKKDLKLYNVTEYRNLTIKEMKIVD